MIFSIISLETFILSEVLSETVDVSIKPGMFCLMNFFMFSIEPKWNTSPEELGDC